MARAAFLLIGFLGLRSYLHRRGVLGCGPEALPSILTTRSYGNSEQSNNATPSSGKNSRETSGAGRVGAGLSAEASRMRETLAPDPLRLARSGQGGLRSPIHGSLMAFAPSRRLWQSQDLAQGSFPVQCQRWGQWGHTTVPATGQCSHQSY